MAPGNHDFKVPRAMNLTLPLPLVSSLAQGEPTWLFCGIQTRGFRARKVCKMVRRHF